MTEKLYENNAYLRKFDAEVVSCTAAGKDWEVTLDKTAFYPEGGGQPCDLGTLGDAAVLDVQIRGGEIVHRCDRPLEAGSRVRGEIDWDRRFDLMQQHSGEHLVSGLIHAKYGYDNVGFHMGKDSITIDFNGEIDEAGLLEIEEEANRVIYENVASEVLYPSREELSQMPYRSKKALEGQVRIVRFPGVDLCACCGTHVAHTGEIGLIRLFSCVKFRSGVRIEMLCGQRCLRYLREIQKQNHEVSMQLSAKPLETGGAVRRILDELSAAKARLAAMEEEAFERKAEALRGRGDVLLLEPPMEPDSVRKLCDRVLSACGGRCAVFAGSDEGGFKYAIGGGRGDLRALAKELNTALRGRGGGKPSFVQGSVAAVGEEIAAFFAAKKGE